MTLPPSWCVTIEADNKSVIMAPVAVPKVEDLKIEDKEEDKKPDEVEVEVEDDGDDDDDEEGAGPAGDASKKKKKKKKRELASCDIADS